MPGWPEDAEKKGRKAMLCRRVKEVSQSKRKCVLRVGVGITGRGGNRWE